MTNKSRIKIIFTVFLLLVLSIVLYLRRPHKTWDSGWNQGLVSSTEREYYYQKIDQIIKDWQDTKRSAERGDSGRLTDSYKTYFVIDMDKKALWMEENGQIREDDYCEFPLGVKYNFYYYSPGNNTELSGRTVLKMRGYNTDQMNPEMFFLSFNDTKGHLGIDFSSHNRGASKGTGSINKPSFTFSSSAVNPNNLYGSILVTGEEYNQYIESLPDISTMITEDENKKAWNRIEKLLYIEIEKQMLNFGYKITDISVIPGPDFSAARAEIQGINNSIIKKILGGYSLYVFLKIDYLGNDVWYAKSDVNPKFPSSSNRNRVEFEFLVSAAVDIEYSQKSELLKKGRQIQKPFVIPESKWQTTLTNGMKIEFLGICENPSAGKQWWGPDGTIVDYVPYANSLEYDRTNANSKVYEFVWRITHRPANFSIATSFEQSNGSNQSVYNDRYGLSLWPTNSLNIQTSGFDKSKAKTTFIIKLDQNNTNKQTVLFKNISLVPKQNQGFEIEVQEAEE